MTAAQWVKYTGSDEQIAEIKNNLSILRNKEVDSSPTYWGNDPIGFIKERLSDNQVTHYLICNPHPLADMICQWARTGQPVWVRQSYYDQAEEHHGAKIFTTTIPDWNIPGAEYSFTEFKEEV